MKSQIFQEFVTIKWVWSISTQWPVDQAGSMIIKISTCHRTMVLLSSIKTPSEHHLTKRKWTIRMILLIIKYHKKCSSLTWFRETKGTFQCRTLSFCIKIKRDKNLTKIRTFRWVEIPLKTFPWSVWTLEPAQKLVLQHPMQTFGKQIIPDLEDLWDKICSTCPSKKYA